MSKTGSASTRTTTSATSHDTRLPAERFYWAVLDTSILPSHAAKNTRQLGFLFEAVLPVPIENVHAAYVSSDPHSVVACGIDRHTIGELASHDLLRLGPDGLPPFVAEVCGDSLDPRAINLLTDEYEPHAVKRMRTSTTLIACAAMLLVTLILAAGQFRRANDASTHIDGLRQATQAIYDQVLPASASSLPAAARLTAELRSLDRTRSVASSDDTPRDVTPTLASVLASWPSDVYLTTDALNATQGAITISLRLPNEAAAERFERELRTPNGWRLAQPNVRRERDQIAVRVRMEPGEHQDRSPS